jgi:oligoendopeptidase F
VSQDFQAGDFLIFQIESAYGLLRILAIDETESGTVWHLAAYNEMFLDIDAADAALDDSPSLTISCSHLAVTNRAFESTQVARMKNQPLNENELKGYREWTGNPSRKVSDISVRLLLGLR